MKKHKWFMGILSGLMVLTLAGCGIGHSGTRTQSAKQTSSEPQKSNAKSGTQSSKSSSKATDQSSTAQAASSSALSKLVPATQAAIDTWRANAGDTYAKGIVTVMSPNTLVVTMTLKEKMADVDLGVLKTVLVKGVAPAVEQARKQEPGVQFQVRLLNPDGSVVVQTQVTDEALKTVTE
ncbi:hypothetical protein [Lacticaseibacillus salsurivasis]|uniref:hypothetical protein n=1 Tax=Lacticaseibacillus salsurivasis TaxID=3081441 RepID=UPI0030C6F4D1